MIDVENHIGKLFRNQGSLLLKKLGPPRIVPDQTEASLSKAKGGHVRVHKIAFRNRNDATILQQAI